MQSSTLRPFKAGWEKANKRIVLPKNLIEEMLKSVLADNTIQSYQVIDGGCANINIKLNYNDGKKKILRVYLRESEAAYREQSIAHLIQNEIPVPRVEKTGVLDNYHFAVSEFKQGITLRDLLLNEHDFDLEDIMSQVGSLLAKLNHFNFSRAGFLDRQLNVATAIPNDECIQFAKKVLKKQNTSLILSKEIKAAINTSLDKHRSLIENMSGAQLVHADFDPANILVDKVNNRWQVSAILDWEFAFSGSMLWDIANMLRYAHQMPKQFETSFLHGLISSGIALPGHWKTTTQLLNIISLLDCLNRTDRGSAPLRCADIQCLLKDMLQSIDGFY